MDTLRVDTMLASLQEQRNAALNDVVRLHAESAVLQAEVARLHEELKAATAKPKRKSPRA